MRIVSYLPTQLIVHSSDFSVKNVMFDMEVVFTNKPRSALWTSTAYFNDYGRISSDWIAWCKSEDFEVIGHATKYLLVPTSTICICEIDSWDDMLNLPLLEKQPDILSSNDARYLEHLVDFKTLSTMVDGLHYTNKTRIFSCYDCESTVWFNTKWIQSITKLED